MNQNDFVNRQFFILLWTVHTRGCRFIWEKRDWISPGTRDTQATKASHDQHSNFSKFVLMVSSGNTGRSD